MIGIGDVNSPFKVYIGNVPQYADLPMLQSVRPLQPGEVADIGNRCGNGWRKVINVYAKLVFALQSPWHFSEGEFQSWQAWRDAKLLQEDSKTLLLFSKPELLTDTVKPVPSGDVHLVMGKSWAAECLADENLHWVNQDFAVVESKRIIVCPYFDYRQLSNQKIVTLCELLNLWLNEA